GSSVSSTRSFHRFGGQEREPALHVLVAGDRHRLPHLVDHLVGQRGLVLRGEQDVDLPRAGLEEPDGDALVGAVDPALLVGRTLGPHRGVAEGVDHFALDAHPLAATVRTLLERVMAVRIPKEIIVVDDGSTDGTPTALEEVQAAIPDTPDNRLTLLFRPRNRGKGAAVRAAIGRVTGDIVIIQDADLEYDPSEYPRLIQPILDGHADVVYGSRFVGSPRRVLMFWHTVGNKLLTLVSNMCTNLNLTDMETCYKVFRADILKRIPIRSDRFGLEPELTAKVAHLRCRVNEVPVAYYGRGY